MEKNKYGEERLDVGARDRESEKREREKERGRQRKSVGPISHIA